MRLNRSTDIALRVAMSAAVSTDRLTIDELAARLNLPRNHVAKVVQRLHRLSVLVTVRGRAGGIELDPRALRLRVGHLVRAFEGDEEVVACEQPPCPLRDACRLRSAFRRAREAFLASLDELTLKDITAAPTGAVLLSLGTGERHPDPICDPTATPNSPAGAAQ